jgi:hypothetical protein
LAKNGIKLVEQALETGFRSKSAKVWILAEKSDYKDFIRMYVVSDFFRRKRMKDRLGEIFSMLEDNGAKDVMAKISLCVPLTKREYDKEFGLGLLRGPLTGVGLKRAVRKAAAHTKTRKLAVAQARN